MELVDIATGSIFFIGSICFLPRYSRQLQVFLGGCLCFICGGVLQTWNSAFTLAEAIREKGADSMEACENLMFFLGSSIFLAGTILYWPEEAHYEHVEWMKSLSFGTYFNLFTPEYEGTLLFIAGSLLFAVAAFINAMSQRHKMDSQECKLLIVTTSLYIAGSLLFVVGSILFLPQLGVIPHLEEIAAWCFIIGSICYVVAGVNSLLRISRTDDEREFTTPLMKQAETARLTS